MAKQSILSKHTEISSSHLYFLHQSFHISTAGEHQLETTSNTGEGPFTAKIRSALEQADISHVSLLVEEELRPFFYDV